MLIALIPAAVFLLLFALAWWRNNARLLCGFLFCCAVGFMGVAYAMAAVWLDERWMYWPLILVAFGLILILMFGLYVLIAFLLLNARLMWKRERRSLQNSLTLILGLALLAYAIISAILGRANLPAWARSLQMGVGLTLAAYFVHVFVFLVTCLLCNLARPPKKQQYIVVLGSGLINGQVPPLLAGRINRAIGFYNRQAKKRTPPKLVMSGGRGDDEARSEAAAMRDYATGKGIPAGHILCDDRSANTAENMQFSKQLIEADADGSSYRVLYATSSYHLLRAGIYARSAGLRARGIGAKTAFYYLPSALLREYIAILSLNKKGYVVLTALAFLGGILFNTVLELLRHYVLSPVL